METTERPRYLTVAETAKHIRVALKARIPGQKFSVRSHSYAGGASINVGWVDGPNVDEVEAVVKAFAGATFDGMIDLKSYHTNLVVMPGDDLPTLVHWGADFVFANRDLSPAFMADLLVVADAVLEGDATWHGVEVTEHTYLDGVCAPWGRVYQQGDLRGLARWASAYVTPAQAALVALGATRRDRMMALRAFVEEG